jgi:hypothetical protein
MFRVKMIDNVYKENKNRKNFENFKNSNSKVFNENVIGGHQRVRSLGISSLQNFQRLNSQNLKKNKISKKLPKNNSEIFSTPLKP